MVPWWSPFGQVPEISAEELYDRLARGAKLQLLDVRTRREFAHGHIAGAVNVPIQSLRGELPHLALDRSEPVVAICKTAHRSPAATRVLRAQGFDAVQLAKGMDDWRRQELPVQKA
jgi:rhodanese-related sulfurtransferase